MSKKRKPNIKDQALAYAVRSGDIKMSMLPDKKKKKIRGIVKGPTDTKKLKKAAENKWKVSKRTIKHISRNESDEMIIDFKEFIKNIDEWEDKIEGGLAKNRVPADFDLDDLAKGSEIEMEHSDDPELAIEIAMDHMEEHPNYYDDEIGLPNMERELEDFEKEYETKNKNINMKKKIVTRFNQFSKINEDNEPNPQKIPKENKWKGVIEYNEEIIKSLEDHKFKLEDDASSEPEDFVIFDIMDKTYKFVGEMPEDIRPYIPRSFDHVMNNL